MATTFDTDVEQLRDGAELLPAVGANIVIQSDDVVDESMLDLYETARKRYAAREASGDWRNNISTDARQVVDRTQRLEKSRSIRFDTPYSFAELGLGDRGLDGSDLSYVAKSQSVGFESPSEPPPFGRIFQWALDRNLVPREYDSFYAMVDAIRYTIEREGTDPVKSVVFEWVDTKAEMYEDFQSVVSKSVDAFDREQKRIAATD
jgi:hypothetical protein